MYNLIITAEENAWGNGVYELEKSRALEHTVDELREKYGILNEGTKRTLTSIPSLLAYEQGRGEVAFVAKLTNISMRLSRFDGQCQAASGFISNSSGLLNPR